MSTRIDRYTPAFSRPFREKTNQTFHDLSRKLTQKNSDKNYLMLTFSTINLLPAPAFFIWNKYVYSHEDKENKQECTYFPIQISPSSPSFLAIVCASITIAIVQLGQQKQLIYVFTENDYMSYEETRLS